MKIYTLGHSTRTFEEFLSILKKFGIEVVVDVRRFPRSKKFPWFGKEMLKEKLKENDVEYIHFPELGGFRKEGYVNFSVTEEFEKSVRKLVDLIHGRKGVILCAERYWWRCHRKFIAKKLVEMGYEVLHILDEESVEEHKKNDERMNYVIFCDKKAKKKRLNSSSGH